MFPPEKRSRNADPFQKGSFQSFQNTDKIVGEFFCVFKSSDSLEVLVLPKKQAINFFLVFRLTVMKNFPLVSGSAFIYVFVATFPV